jgi:hypothetical protein
MSLINDALKRAKQTQPLPPPVAAGPAMTPVENQHRRPWPVIVVPVLLLAVVIVATWFFWSAVKASRQGSITGNHTKVAARERDSGADAAASPPNDLTDHSSSSSNGRPTAVAGVKANGADAAQSAATNAVPTTETASAVLPPPKAPFKLQAIFYRAKNPSAVINSKTVFRGDKVADAKVLAIDRESVTLWVNGQTNVLTLP